MSNPDNSSSVITQQPSISEKKQFKTDAETGDYQPVGLLDLAKTDTLKVHQYLDVVEVVLGWERSNRYQVCDGFGKQIFYVYEYGPCYARKLLGASRGLSLRISDNDSQDVISIIRPLRCSSRCCLACFHLQEMEIHSPPGIPIATVREVWSVFTPVFHVFNLRDELLYIIEGSRCRCRACLDMTFQIQREILTSQRLRQVVLSAPCTKVSIQQGLIFDSSTKKNIVAILTKYIGDRCREFIGAGNDFSLTYVQDMGVKEKITIFGAIFLIDFNYFEAHCRC